MSNKNEDTEPTYKVFINPPQEQSPDMVVRGVFGISLEELVNKIRINAGGEYDSLYGKGGK